MKIIKDLRTLNKLAKKFNLSIDKEYKYILNDYSLQTERELKKEGYKIKFFDGCFYPFICKY